MNSNFATDSAPANGEYVLSVIQAWHRQACAVDEGDPDIDLTFETTVATWRDAADLYDWRRLARAMNNEWNIDRSLDEWRSVLEPAKTRTLRDVCGFIARHAMVSKIRPASLFGSQCLAAGAFLTVRSLLRDAGADVHRIAPSTLLHDYTRRYTDVFFGPITKLAPGALPDAKVKHPLYDLAIWATVLALLLLLIAAFVRSPWFMIVAAATCVVSYAATWVVAKCALPKKVSFGELKTFGDLAKALEENSVTQ